MYICIFFLNECILLLSKYYLKKNVVAIATEISSKQETEICFGHFIFTIYSKTKLSSADEVKGRLLQLLLNQSQGLLMNTGCPIEKVRKNLSSAIF
jgi:hypothetical protein